MVDTVPAIDFDSNSELGKMRVTTILMVSGGVRALESHAVES